MMPPSVSRVVDRYFAHLSAETVGFPRGVYLLGSIALGDYHEGRSDIDFVAVTNGPLNAGDVACLADVHTEMMKLGTPRFDGFYIEARHLAEAPAPEQAMAFVQDGLFRPGGPCFEVNPVTWRLWAEQGVALRGSAPDELGLVIDEAALRRFEVSNLQSYWLEWVRKTRSSLPAPAGRMQADLLDWGILGVARIACTLATGRVVSKTEAGRWILENCEDADAELILAALAARRGDIADLPIGQALAALDFMKKTIERSCSLARTSGTA